MDEDKLYDARKLKAAAKRIAEKFNLDIVDFSISPSDVHGVDNDNARVIFKIRSIKSFVSRHESQIDSAFNEIISGFDTKEDTIREDIDKWMEE